MEVVSNAGIYLLIKWFSWRQSIFKGGIFFFFPRAGIWGYSAILLYVRNISVLAFCF